MNLSRKNLKILFPILWAILIFILSSIPGNEYPSTTFDYAPIAHFIEYFILTILILNIFEKITFKNFLLTLIITILFAISDEIHQSFVINRSASFLDFLIDALAILVAIKIYLFLPLRRGE